MVARLDDTLISLKQVNTIDYLVINCKCAKSLLKHRIQKSMKPQSVVKSADINKPTKS